ncbi:TetR/AcrR family transcriptional regulator [Novosphingobium soli]|uniref:TetR/AcrR family transcriptional regulator n=1 Tax=Novosphingobium soli TaxID=574956 RepID=A0ABV6CUY5_9SPHN
MTGASAKPARRMATRRSATHDALLDAVEAIMHEEGYAALTSRRVALRAGINQQTLYYYFATMDALLLAAYRRRTGAMRARVEAALAQERPLHALWACFSDPFDAALTMEYLALANHNEAVRGETVAFGEQLRALQVAAPALSGLLPPDAPAHPLGLVMALTWVAHLMGFEATLGLRGGHQEATALAQWALGRVEP